MEHDEKVTLSDKINNFFEQNRKKVLIVFAGIFIAVIAVVVSFMIFENKKKSAMSKIETLILEFEKFKSDNLKNSSDSLTEEEKKKLAEAESTLIEKLAAYSDNNNYAGFMACQQIADIYFRNNDFEKALTYYEKLNLPKDRYISAMSLDKMKRRLSFTKRLWTTPNFHSRHVHFLMLLVSRKILT